MKNQVKVSPSEMAKQVAKGKAKTIETRTKNRVSNRAKQSPVKAEISGIVYLKEGVTSAQFNAYKKATNNAVKEERSSISQCISDAIKYDKGFFESLNLSNSALKNLIKPTVILNHATNSQLIKYANSLTKIGYIKFNVWYTLGYIKSELDGKTPNPNAVEFFEAVRDGNTNEVVKVTKKINAEILKAKKEMAKAKK